MHSALADSLGFPEFFYVLWLVIELSRLPRRRIQRTSTCMERPPRRKEVAIPADIKNVSADLHVERSPENEGGGIAKACDSPFGTNLRQCRSGLALNHCALLVLQARCCSERSLLLHSHPEVSSAGQHPRHPLLSFA